MQDPVEPLLFPYLPTTGLPGSFDGLMRTTAHLLRQAAAAVSLDPYQILAVPRSASTGEIKSAYYALVKTHHPDLASAHANADGKGKGKGRAREREGLEFKDIVSAYELLRDPKKREAYLRYGFGWSTSTGGAAGAGRPDVGFNYNNMHNPWGDPKTRRHRHAHERGRYPSSSWDFGHADTTEFYSSNPGPSTSTNKDRSGIYTSNASFMSILAGMSLLLYSVQFWRLAPALPDSGGTTSPPGLMSFDNIVAGDPKDAPIYRQSSMMRGRDRHHEDASRALGAAREGAQRYGNARRDNIRRRVRESTLEAIESGRLGTGHGLPSSSSSADAALPTPDDPNNPLVYSRRRERELGAHHPPATLQRPRAGQRRNTLGGDDDVEGEKEQASV